MAIDLDVLAQAAKRRRSVVTETATEALAAGRRTAFLCHSHADATYVEGVVVLLREAGWDVYVDWKDASMPPVPDARTASKIRRRIGIADFFIFLATPNSLASRWCPWEIGIADGIKDHECIFVIATKRGQTYYGNEYLGLYRQIDFSNKNRLAAWHPGKTKGTPVMKL